MPTVETLLDLVAERVGGCAVVASDEFFAPKENLLKPGRGVFVEGKYTERGKWMDGWETRRRRDEGHDWCILRLGLPGEVAQVVVDTNHFRGNHPESFSLDAAILSSDTPEGALTDAPEFREIVPRTKLQGHAENRFDVPTRERWTHLRLHIYPDGGVARFRALGVVVPEWTPGEDLVDLVAVERGGRVLGCNDCFFSDPWNLLMPGRAANMGDGWETRRRRTPGHDWVELALGRPGVLEKILVDTNHFKGNYPESCRIEGTGAGGETVEILPRTTLEADREHVFESEISPHEAIDRVRLQIFPDGGVSRLRLFGRPVPETGS